MTFDPVRRLLDIEDIRSVAARYCWAIDTRDEELFATVFLHDATALLGPTMCDGRDAIWRRIMATIRPLDASQHLVGTHDINFGTDPDTATHRCQLHAQHVRRGLANGEQFIVAGTYDDVVVRTADGWRIRHRVLTAVWTSGNPEVLAHTRA